MPLARTDDCTARARRHATVGDALADAGDEWAVVCWFYSAYHYVRAALIADPIFDDLSRLQSVYQPLVPDDRYVSKHKGRRGGAPELGINEVVLKLYPAIAGPYDKLHQASTDVRYEHGLRGDLSQLRPLLSTIEGDYAAGKLIAVYSRPD